MRQIYYDTQKDTVTSGHSKKVFSKRLPAGYILVAFSCFACSLDRASGDRIDILVDDGASEHIIRGKKPDIDHTGIDVTSPVAIGGNDRIVGHFPDATIGHVIELHILGHILPDDEWRRSGG